MIIALNNKCNLTREEYLKYQENLKNLKAPFTMILCPTNLYIGDFNLSNMKLGAQNVSSKESGAYTGEVSASQLKSFGVTYCIVGHSERREYQRETDQEINEKIKQLLKEEIFPILCVGETKKERESNLTTKKIAEELKEATKSLTEKEKQQIIIAYEPIWAIGTGKTATSEDANNAIKEIRNKIEQIYGKEVAEDVIIQYGGSVKSKNAKELFTMSDIDGGLVGGASLDPEEFSKIVNYDV